MVKSLTYILKRAILLLLTINIVYLSTCFLYYKDGFSIKETLYNKSYKYIYLNNEDEPPTINFQHEIDKLLKKVDDNINNKYWLKDTHLTSTQVGVNPNHFLSDSVDSDSWINKNTLHYDIRLTLSLYLNYIKGEHQKRDAAIESAIEAQKAAKKEKIVGGGTGTGGTGTGVDGVAGVEKREDKELETETETETVEIDYAALGATPLSVPFHWVDWLDLTGMNDELSVSVNERTRCDWFEKTVDHGNNFRIPHLKCTNNDELAPKSIKEFGFRTHDQLPGFIIDSHSLNRGTIDVRIAQARSYSMTHMPNPYRLIFLNQDNGTYEVDVDNTLPKKRILESNLMQSYLRNKDLLKNNGKAPKLINLDPVEEFRDLKNAIKPTYIQPEGDIYKVYNVTHSQDGNPKLLPIPKEAFHYGPQDIDNQLEVFKGLNEIIPLNFIEQSYVNSLELSKARNTKTEDVYFRQATLRDRRHDKKNKDNDKGYHYDWRFFVGTLNNYKEDWTPEEMTLRQEVILDRLARTWFRFAEEKGLISWIMHGPLLSWYWDGMMFPFDNDLDIQMPIKDLARLGQLYNQTLVIEDLEEGFGKYLIDVGTFIHNRDISLKENHIDARFIDVDTGLYIDITGLSTSDAEIPEDFEKDKELVKISKDNADDEVYNDRRKHFYKHGQLSPLKYSMLGGVPVLIPNDISQRLMFEYPTGLTQTEFHSWYFIPKISLWVHKDRLTAAFDDNDFRKISDNQDEHGKIDDNKLNELILDIDEDSVIKLLSTDDDILCEYYKTKELTDIHQLENKYLFTTKMDKKLDEGDKYYEHVVVQDRMLSGKDYDDYTKFVNGKIKMAKPLRKSLFQYEYIDQPRHHLEFVKKEEEKKTRNKFK